MINNPYELEKLARERQRELLRDGEPRVGAGRRRMGRRERGVITALLLLELLLLLVAPVAAQPFEPPLIDGGNMTDSAQSVVIDSAGNRYVAGKFNRGTTLGSGGPGGVELVGRNGFFSLLPLAQCRHLGAHLCRPAGPGRAGRRA